MLLRGAPEVRAVAERVIAEHHPELLESGFRFEFVFLEKAPVSHGRVVAGRARRVSGLAAWWREFGGNPESVTEFSSGEVFGVVEIVEPIWVRLRESQRRALVDHELSHFRVDVDLDGLPVLKVRGHDFEEFTGVIRRHGLWSASSDAAARAFGAQLADALDDLEASLSSDSGDVGGDGDG